MAVSLDAVRATNASLGKLGQGLVALFVGGTSGIGESTLRAFAQRATNSKVYVVGRNKEAADKIKSDFASTSIEFISADVSLLGEVDRVCAELSQKEKKLNLLFLSAGYLTLQGRQEGLDKKFSLNYYSRLRFITNLLPLLREGSSSSPHHARVVTVLGAGHEAPLIMDDLSLKHNFSIKNCANQSVTMTTLALAKLAQSEPGISFIHSSPGGVNTNVARDMNVFLRTAFKAVAVLAKPLMVDLTESGERHLFAGVAPIYPPAKGDHPAIAELPTKTSIAEGYYGETGGGAYLINWNGSPATSTRAFLKQQKDEGIIEKVWQHTIDTFKDVEAQHAAL